MEFKGNQNKVIEYGKGTLLVEAGPGSGKTTVIVERIKHLIKQGVDPESFLVITFTNKAADNLKYKLRKELSNEIVLKMQISTIHSFCLEFLKERDIQVRLIDDDSSEMKTLFIKKFSEELGFIGESTVLDYQIPAVISKFGEYGSFNVDSEMLEGMISESRPVTQSYINFVNSMNYFSKKLIDDHDNNLDSDDEDFNLKSYKKNWYNARFRQIIKAYPIYLKLLDENGYVDYDTLQKKTMEELARDSKTQFTTVFVDEFQDTDPLQFRIFQHLRKHCDYFTAVGDVDQHIYAFRSSFNDFFDELVKLEGHETIPLDINFRSTVNIVNLTEKFISPQRKDTSNKNMKSDGKPYNNPNFLIENEDSDDEAVNIYQIIKYLKENQLIRDYSDVAVLYRKHSDKTIKNLTEMLSNDEISFSIKGQKDLSDKPWVKSIKTLLWYVSRKTYLGHIPSKEELKEESNLNAFCGDYFVTPFWNLDQSTIDYLHSLQEDFYDDIIRIENGFRKERGVSRVRNAKRVKDNEDLDTLTKIFRQVQVPIIDLEKIENPKDKKFFTHLEAIREEIYPKKSESAEDNGELISESANTELISDNSSIEMESDSQEESEPLTVLAVFYKLLALSDIYEHEMSYDEIADIALITQTISNYESFISETDIRGAFFFLNDAIKKYDSHHKDDEGVQLMTIHGAKGLEFPVTIITSLKKDSFPMEVKDPDRNEDYVFPNDTYYTPNECLGYKTTLKKENDEWVPKTISIEDENILSAEEEDRVLYVAMTRAKDLLILSTIGEVPEQIERIKDSLTDFSYDELDKVKFEWDFEESSPKGEDEDIKDELESLEEPVVLNYSRYTQYISCPFKYDLSYNLGFMRSGSAKAANRGSVFHEIMEELNLKLLDGITVSKEELEEIIINHYKPMFDIEEGDEEFKEFKNNVINYYYKYSVNREVLEAEFDFELLRDNYLLNGAIDLVYREENGEVVILDYKYAEFDENHIDAYVKQSYIYASALREIPEYEKYDIKKAIIHFVKGDKPYVVDIDEERMNNEKANLNVIAGKIKNDEYERKPEKAEECSRCSYRYFCKPKEYASQLYE